MILVLETPVGMHHVLGSPLTPHAPPLPLSSLIPEGEYQDWASSGAQIEGIATLLATLRWLVRTNSTSKLGTRLYCTVVTPRRLSESGTATVVLAGYRH